MLATIVTKNEELQQIVQLSDSNNRTRISEQEKKSEGFVSWNYSFDLLKKMNEQYPHVIVKDNNKVVGYALVALKEAIHFHSDLGIMIQDLDKILYNTK